jgi:hypothetical protein
MAVKTKKAQPQDKSPEKEGLIRDLIKSIEDKGFEVRREKLKQGPGWKVTSGACRLEAKKIVFLDSRLAQDDQIEFLKIKTEGIVGVPSVEVATEAEVPQP